jgi:hypothetical protein
MTKQERKVYNALTKLGAKVEDNTDGYYEERATLWIDFEEPQNYDFADYWSNPCGTDEFNKTMNDLGMYWEWHNPGFASIHVM